MVVLKAMELSQLRSTEPPPASAICKADSVQLVTVPLARRVMGAVRITAASKGHTQAKR